MTKDAVRTSALSSGGPLKATADGGILLLDDLAFEDAWIALSDVERSAIGRPGFDRYRELTGYMRRRSVPTSSKGAAGDDGEERNRELIVGEKGQIKPCEHNALQLISTDKQFNDLHFDDFLNRIQFEGRDWTDNDDRQTLCWIQQAHSAPGFTLGQIRNAVALTAHHRKRDSLRDFILGLPNWDGIPRIEYAFHEAWGCADTPLVRAASRNLFIALVARAEVPGSQVDTLWVFEGPQGSFKSLALRALGGRFHAEISAPIGASDFYREMRGIWIAELSELDSLRGREATTTKRILSAPSDRFVEKYEKHASTYPRRAVAVATTNEAAYWQDHTGARRLVPAATGDINIDMIETNRLQWFAEARGLYQSGASWWEFPPAIAAAQEERQQIDPWEDLLRGLIVNGREVVHGYDSITKAPLVQTVRWPEQWISSAAIMQDWLKLAPHQQGQSSGARLGRVMRRLGFRPQRFGNARERGWIADTSGDGNE